MTRDEIENTQAGYELDARICEFMKDTPEEVWGHKANDGNGWYDIIGSRFYAESVFNQRKYLHDKAHVAMLLKYKKYSTDISEAWIVLERIKTDLANWVVVECANYSWRVRVYFHDQSRVHIEVLADTAPLAICRAALLAVMTETA